MVARELVLVKLDKNLICVLVVAQHVGFDVDLIPVERSSNSLSFVNSLISAWSNIPVDGNEELVLDWAFVLSSNLELGYLVIIEGALQLTKYRNSARFRLFLILERQLKLLIFCFHQLR